MRTFLSTFTFLRTFLSNFFASNTFLSKFAQKSAQKSTQKSPQGKKSSKKYSKKSFYFTFLNSKPLSKMRLWSNIVALPVGKPKCASVQVLPFLPSVYTDTQSFIQNCKNCVDGKLSDIVRSLWWALLPKCFLLRR